MAFSLSKSVFLFLGLFLICSQAAHAQSTDDNTVYLTEQELNQTLTDFQSKLTEKMNERIQEEIEKQVSEKLQGSIEDKCVVCSGQTQPTNNSNDVINNAMIWGTVGGALAGLVAGAAIAIVVKEFVNVKKYERMGSKP